MRTARLLCHLLTGLCLLDIALSLKICAFNVQKFGQAKVAKKIVLERLVKIISRCDLCLIQEVVDAKGTAIPILVERLKSVHNFSHVDSERLGNSTYKEQYVYIYRPDLLQIQVQFPYLLPDEGEANDIEAFSRKPFIVRLHSLGNLTVVKDFILVGLHTSPKTAIPEMEELYDVFQAIREKLETESVMIMGDLNAACAYASKKALDSLRIRKDTNFHWLIGDDINTTVGDRVCAYDRIVVHGKELLSAIVPNSAKPYNFTEDLGLTKEEAKAVSDHFPVEVDLKNSTGDHHHHEL